MAYQCFKTELDPVSIDLDVWWGLLWKPLEKSNNQGELVISSHGYH